MITIERFREDLARVMAKGKLTQMEVAERCNVPQATICLFLKGERGLSAVSMLRLWSLVYGDAVHPACRQTDVED